MCPVRRCRVREKLVWRRWSRLLNPNETVLVWLHSLSFDTIFDRLHNLINIFMSLHIKSATHKYNQLHCFGYNIFGNYT